MGKKCFFVAENFNFRNFIWIWISNFFGVATSFEDLLWIKTEVRVRSEIEIQFMKDLKKKLDDFYIRADITHETSQIVIAELKNDEKYAESKIWYFYFSG